MISHPEKVLFPEDGITKGELAAYYEALAPLMVPHMRNRPVTMERYPAGIGKPGFMQKDVSKGFPDWLQRVDAPKKGGVVHHPLVTDTRSLLWLANQNCITPHIWSSRAPNLYQPDICVFDLDPSEDDSEVLRGAALLVRDVLAELGLPSWGKNERLEGLPHCRAARRQAWLRRRLPLRRASRPSARGARPGASDTGVHQGRPRQPHLYRHRPQRV